MDTLEFYADALENDLDDDLFNTIDATEESENDTSKSEIKYPFDPRQIKITVATSTIFNLAQRIKRTTSEHKEIDLYLDFQRKTNLWKPDRQSRLIESLLLRFPLPAFYFDVELDENGDEIWLVVDGIQRLSTIQNFIVNNSLKLEGLEILKGYEGLTFKELDNTLRRRILETNVTTYLIQPGTPKEVKYNIFKRINTGGLGLTPMEIRHALNQKGYAGRFLKELTENEDSFFKDFLVYNKITKVDRMEDRELLLRYAAFTLTPFKDYEPSLSNFLDTAMEKLDAISWEACENLSSNLEKAIETYIQIFGNTRFGRTLTNRCRLNSALFEVWTSELGKLDDDQRYLLLIRQGNLKEAYQYLLLNDTTFIGSFTRRTSNKSILRERFNKIHNLIQQFLHD